MSVAKLSAGDGFSYYLRVIATHDANERGRQPLADYYSERGESPGVWLGSGLRSLGITAGEQVRESQMRALIGEGLHPDADAIIDEAIATQIGLGAKRKDAIRYAHAQARLGAPFSRYTFAEGSYRHQVAEAFAAWNAEHGFGEDQLVPVEVRQQIRTDTARRMFATEHGRVPDNDRELSSWIAVSSRPVRTAVAAYDLTFSPVKSVSALWAVASREVAEAIEAAHHAAIADALVYLESHATYTRIGRHSVRQVEVEGLIATAFDHRDSRAGDPDLHTHVVISNKVRRLDGQWGALDGRMIYRHNVAASELYNTRLEHHLEQGLGLVFADRATAAGKRPIREIVGVDERLLAVWSKRRAAITAATGELARQFAADHGREPTPMELLDLAQQATLSTRRGKLPARSRAEQRTAWRADAVGVLGDEAAVEAMVERVLSQALPGRGAIVIGEVARAAVEVVAQSRATWQHHHIRAEVERQLRGAVAPGEWAGLVEQIIDAALSPPISLRLGLPEQVPPAPGLTRSDGTSVYTTARSTRYTSQAILDAEQRLIAASGRHDGRTLPAAAIETAIIEHAANNPGRALNAGQREMVRTFATSGARLQVGLAPAGTGKTTAMQVLTRAWTDAGGTVLGLAPTGSAAAVLAEEIGSPTATVDMLIAQVSRAASDPRHVPPDWVNRVGPGTLVIVDEAAKCSTLSLDSAVGWLLQRGASVRAIGDDRQLASVAAGGVIRDIVARTGAATLSQVMRFTDPGERAASLAIRDGDPAGLAHYLDHDRLRTGPLDVVVEDVFAAWAADIDNGLDSALLAPTRELVTALNHRARTARLARDGGIDGREVALADGLSASAGDVICTRRNNYQLRISATDTVRNGYRWTVRKVHPDGRITATHLGSGRRVTLPADYVREHTHLGYATTIDTSQGMTVDTCHGVLTGRESRAQAYVMLTRGRTRNHIYLATTDGDTAPTAWPTVLPPTALDVLTGILAREGTQTSASTDQREDADPRQRLAGVVDAYCDALAVAAETRVGAAQLAAIDAAAEQVHPGLTAAAAYPVLRQHLATLALHGHDPITALRTAARGRELHTADDPAAVLDWRIDSTGEHHQRPGPLTWVPELPPVLAADPQFGPHLQARRDQIQDLVAQITATTRAWTPVNAPRWAQPLLDAPRLAADLAIWRAAHGIDDTDRRLTGPPRYPTAERRTQHHLDTRAATRLGDHNVDVRRWQPLADQLGTGITADPYWPILARELTAAARTGLDIPRALTRAAAVRPLPVEQPAAALRWRLTETLDTHPPHPPFVDALQQMRDDPLRRMTDAELDAHIRYLAGVVQHDGLMEAIRFAGGDSQRALPRVQDRHADEDREAAAILAAQAAARTAQAAAREHAAAAAELARLRQAPVPSKLLRRNAHNTHQATLAELASETERLRQAALTAEHAARDAAYRTHTPQARWDRALARHGDHERRQAELDTARDTDAQRDADQAAGRARVDAIRDQRRTAVGERGRRRALTDPERALEHRARIEIHGGQLPAEPDERPQQQLDSYQHDASAGRNQGTDIGP
ncbi:relaxase domain-containing protein [Nocardia higoensis]|uniref:Relaxase domain-containing protein n=1 Tax=Nocardia higoensis TaxID=228599 RepID=A0ABS0DIE5_9NOCA|nr:MobF family relaxase [Nocardia higoensis]MBF6358237.1 relaxase domain-containing protein [Nocardia higoensis]